MYHANSVTLITLKIRKRIRRLGPQWNKRITTDVARQLPRTFGIFRSRGSRPLPTLKRSYQRYSRCRSNTNDLLLSTRTPPNPQIWTPGRGIHAGGSSGGRCCETPCACKGARSQCIAGPAAISVWCGFARQKIRITRAYSFLCLAGIYGCAYADRLDTSRSREKN